MNKPIFDRKDFTLCSVPVPRGYPQSQTHSGIALHNGRYYLTTSPYPERKYTRWQFYPRYILRKLTNERLFPNGDFYENPCLYVGEKGDINEVPVNFHPITPFPLANTPNRLNGLPAYNSDPDIFVEKDTFYLLNRTVYRKKMQKHGYESETHIHLLSGKLNGDSMQILTDDLIKVWDKPYVSPCLTKFGEQYLFTYLDTCSALDAQTFDGLFIQRINCIEAVKGDSDTEQVEVISHELLPWHMSLFQYENKLYTIIACVKRGDVTCKILQMFGEFNDDLSELHIYQTPLTDYNSYRGAACVQPGGMLVLYTTTVHEKVPGSKSVDGRDILMASMPFDSFLDKIRSHS